MFARGRLKRRGPSDSAYNPVKLRELNTRRPYPFLYGAISGGFPQETPLQTALSGGFPQETMNPLQNISRGFPQERTNPPQNMWSAYPHHLQHTLREGKFENVTHSVAPGNMLGNAIRDAVTSEELTVSGNGGVYHALSHQQGSGLHGSHGDVPHYDNSRYHDNRVSNMLNPHVQVHNQDYGHSTHASSSYPNQNRCDNTIFHNHSNGWLPRGQCDSLKQHVSGNMAHPTLNDCRNYTAANQHHGIQQNNYNNQHCGKRNYDDQHVRNINYHTNDTYGHYGLSARDMSGPQVTCAALGGQNENQSAIMPRSDCMQASSGERNYTYDSHASNSDQPCKRRRLESSANVSNTSVAYHDQSASGKLVTSPVSSVTSSVSREASPSCSVLTSPKQEIFSCQEKSSCQMLVRDNAMGGANTFTHGSGSRDKIINMSSESRDKMITIGNDQSCPYNTNSGSRDKINTNQQQSPPCDMNSMNNVCMNNGSRDKAVTNGSDQSSTYTMSTSTCPDYMSPGAHTVSPSSSNSTCQEHSSPGTDPLPYSTHCLYGSVYPGVKSSWLLTPLETMTTECVSGLPRDIKTQSLCIQ